MAHGPLQKSTQINTKQHVVFLLHQCDGCTCFCAIRSAMFGSVLDNATLISWIASNRFRAVGLMESRPGAENADSDSCWFFWNVLRGPQKDRGTQFENHWDRQRQLRDFKYLPLRIQLADKKKVWRKAGKILNTQEKVFLLHATTTIYRLSAFNNAMHLCKRRGFDDGLIHVRMEKSVCLTSCMGVNIIYKVWTSQILITFWATVSGKFSLQF